MDSALGIRYKDGVILATDCAVTYSIFRLKVIINEIYVKIFSHFFILVS